MITLAPVFMAKRLPTNALLVRLEAPRASAEVGEAAEAPSGIAKGGKNRPILALNFFPVSWPLAINHVGSLRTLEAKGRRKWERKVEKLLHGCVFYFGPKGPVDSLSASDRESTN